MNPTKKLVVAMVFLQFVLYSCSFPPFFGPWPPRPIPVAHHEGANGYGDFVELSGAKGPNDSIILNFNFVSDYAFSNTELALQGYSTGQTYYVEITGSAQQFIFNDDLTWNDSRKQVVVSNNDWMSLRLANKELIAGPIQVNTTDVVYFSIGHGGPMSPDMLCPEGNHFRYEAQVLPYHSDASNDDLVRVLYKHDLGACVYTFQGADLLDVTDVIRIGEYTTKITSNAIMRGGRDIMMLPIKHVVANSYVSNIGFNNFFTYSIFYGKDYILYFNTDEEWSAFVSDGTILDVASAISGEAIEAVHLLYDNKVMVWTNRYHSWVLSIEASTGIVVDAFFPELMAPVGDSKEPVLKRVYDINILRHSVAADTALFFSPGVGSSFLQGGPFYAGVSHIHFLAWGDVPDTPQSDCPVDFIRSYYRKIGETGYYLDRYDCDRFR